MALPEGTYVLHIDNDGLNNHCGNLVLVRGWQHPYLAPRVVLAGTDQRGNIFYLHDVIMERMITDGHPNAVPQDYSEDIDVWCLEEEVDSWENLMAVEYLTVDALSC